MKFSVYTQHLTFLLHVVVLLRVRCTPYTTSTDWLESNLKAFINFNRTFFSFESWIVLLSLFKESAVAELIQSKMIEYVKYLL